MIEVTHQCPPRGASGIMPCCGRTPVEVPRTDRMTYKPSLVNCSVFTELEQRISGVVDHANQRLDEAIAALDDPRWEEAAL